MVRRPPSMDLYHAVTVAADALAESWGEPGVAALLAWGQPAEIEVIYCRGLEDSVCRGLATSPGRTVVDGVRRSGEPVLVRTSRLEDGTELRNALEHGDLEGLLLVPLFAWEGEVGVLCVEVAEGIDAMEAGITPEVRLEVDRVSRVLRGLQLTAAHSALQANLSEDRRQPPEGFDGTIVIDRWERVVFASGLIEGLPGWSRQGPFGRPIDGLPGGPLIAELELSEPGELQWQEHLFPPLADHAMPVALAAIPFAPVRAGEQGGRIILIRDLRAEKEARAGTQHLLGLALRVASAMEAVRHDLETTATGNDEAPMADRFGRYLQEVARRTEDAPRLIQAAVANAEGEPREPVDINGLMHEIVAPQERALLSEGVRILKFLRPELPRTPVGPIELQHILTGLIDLARDSLRPGGGTLTLRTWEESGEVFVAISDDGRGVEVPAGQDAFEPLYDVAEGAAAEAFLKSAKEQVAAWGGRLMLEARPGMWNRVTVMLPVDRRARTPRQTAMPPAVRVAEDAEGALHVLVVDDNPSLRSVIRRYLERRGHKVSEAEDGQAALEMVGGGSFDRIVVDVRMPGTDGPTFYKRLDGVAPEMQDRTIFMTGGFLEEETEDFIESTGRPAIQKPFDLSEMARTVEG